MYGSIIHQNLFVAYFVFWQRPGSSSDDDDDDTEPATQIQMRKNTINQYKTT